MAPGAFPILASGAALQGREAAPHIQSANPSASRQRDLATLQKAAGEFEAILLQSLWKSMKETVSAGEDGEGGDEGEGAQDLTLESFDESGIQAMSQLVGSAGGLGFKSLIISSLTPRLEPAPATGFGTALASKGCS
jgi:Rod binding domain-containing protein